MKISNPIQNEAEKAVAVDLILSANSKQICRVPLWRISRDRGKGELTAAIGIYGLQVQIHTSQSFRDTDPSHRSVWVYGRDGVLCFEGNDPALLDRIELLYYKTVAI